MLTMPNLASHRLRSLADDEQLGNAAIPAISRFSYSVASGMRDAAPAAHADESGAEP
jgi:hypothetical protein